MSEISTELILVTGFLGSGKTTFLREGMEGLEPSKTARLYQEGGIRIPHQYRMGSALLPNLEQTLTQEPAYILMETSGFAQPGTLTQFVAEAKRRNPGKLRFLGTICMIDTLRFLKLFSSAVSLHEQAVYADCFVLSKADLAEPSHIPEIQKILQVIRPGAPVFIWGRSPASFQGVYAALNKTFWRDPLETPGGKKPKSTTLIPEAPVNREHLEAFLSQMAPKTFNIKGFIYLKIKGNYPLVNVESRENRLILNLVPSKDPQALGLTFVWKQPSMSDQEFIRAWITLTGVKGDLIAS